MLAEPGRARGVGLPRRNNSTGRSRETRYFRAGRFELAAGRPPPPALRSGGGTPAARKPGSAGSRPSSPRPPEDTRLSKAAPAGPERPCRERRGPPAGDGLGNRGAIRARLLCMNREHGGTQAVSRRPGSPREARREGPKVLVQQGQHPISFSADAGCSSRRWLKVKGYNLGLRSRSVQSFWTLSRVSRVRHRSMSCTREASGRVRLVSR